MCSRYSRQRSSRDFWPLLYSMSTPRAFMRLMNDGSSIAALAWGAERLDWRVTAPEEEFFEDEVEVTQPLSSAAVPAAP